MALVFNLKGGTVRSTIRTLPTAFSKGKRYRLMGGGQTNSKCDGGICEAQIACQDNRPEDCIFEVACDTITPSVSTGP